MKKRFEFPSDDNNFPDDLFPSYEEEEYDDDEDGEEGGDLEEIAIELDRRHLNQKILFHTIKSLEKSWLWMFRSEETKQKMIIEAYMTNQHLVAMGSFEEQDD